MVCSLRTSWQKLDFFLDFTQCQVTEEEPVENNESAVPEIEEKPITEVLDFAMREIVKQDALTDELICPMLRTVFILISKV